MDISSYIGLFLLKNNSCYIHGLANLELRRKPSVYDGTSLTAPFMEIHAVPATVVDDNLSNFIATNEQISISKASAALKEYTDQVKTELKQGKEVPLSTLGSFIEVNNKVQFATHPHFSYAPARIPVEKHSPKRPAPDAGGSYRPQSIPVPAPNYPQQGQGYAPQPAPYQEPPIEGSRINWTRILIALVVLGLLAAGFIFSMRYMKSGTPAVHIDTLATQVPMQDVQPVENSLTTDSSAITDTSVIPETAPDAGIEENTTPTSTQPTVNKPAATNTPVTGTPAVNNAPAAVKPTGPMTTFKAILATYDDRDKAEKRYKQLKSYGNNVELKEEDPTLIYVLMPLTCPVKDKSKVLDSLQRNFNPAGISVY